MDNDRMSFLQNVLSYATATTDTTAPPEHRELNPDDKEFLAKALETTSINPIDEIQKCIICLQNEAQSDRHYEALELLRDWCEDINFAIDFHKMNGYSLLPALLNHPNDDMRILACELVGTLAQNNDYCQRTLIEENFLSVLFDKLENDTNEHVKVKALFAISCLVRDFFDGQEKLLAIKGVDVLINVIQLPIEKLQIKCCFLVSSICSNLEIKAEFTRLHLIEKLVNMYRQTQLNIHEFVLAAIISLIDNNPKAIKQAKNMNLDFKNIIMQRLTIVENDPSCLEEKQNATALMESLFKN